MSEQLRNALAPFRHMRVEVDDAKNQAEVFDLHDGKRTLVAYARNAEVGHEWNRHFEQLRQALDGPDWTAPLPELTGFKPVVVYFKTDQLRDEFMDRMRETRPNMIARKL